MLALKPTSFAFDPVIHVADEKIHMPNYELVWNVPEVGNNGYVYFTLTFVVNEALEKALGALIRERGLVSAAWASFEKCLYVTVSAYLCNGRLTGTKFGLVVPNSPLFQVLEDFPLDIELNAEVIDLNLGSIYYTPASNLDLKDSWRERQEKSEYNRYLVNVVLVTTANLNIHNPKSKVHYGQIHQINSIQSDGLNTSLKELRQRILENALDKLTFTPGGNLSINKNSAEYACYEWNDAKINYSGAIGINTFSYHGRDFILTVSVEPLTA